MTSKNAKCRYPSARFILVIVVTTNLKYSFNNILMSCIFDAIIVVVPYFVVDIVRITSIIIIIITTITNSIITGSSAHPAAAISYLYCSSTFYVPHYTKS